MFYRILLALFILTGCVLLPVSAAPAIGDLEVDATTASSWQELAKRSELIVIAWADSAGHSYPTRHTVDQGKLVNYTQTLQIKKVLKGAPPRLLNVVSTGVEPMPDASSPLNFKYPGPLGEGNYVLFLQPVKGTSYYSITGLWQGVYPLYQGRTIALEGVGFAELNQLSLAELELKLKSATP
ncbi:hypothetical protein J31TS6_48540 [Brevibacillus reuszeri]|uniref:hypothetical protein n=1 Tax=Brevibacillus reuszeri TaxID=54915 RepID=UPI001B13D490|nr:hypothetical protein [Brevibacillus reuszeri]GIO08826.1 hypothetical protein J31TS6_48540 [Brevibacillus reuszeri]